ncbi:hypothetical protein [Acetobacter sp.]|uniref:hypothetical protein n=1 Tax=Acetobacter sp. TaxID=440 RepID=UPI0039EAE42F
MLYILVFFILGLRAGGRACSGQRGIYSGLLLSSMRLGFPERLCFATLTCSPWRWVLVAPNPSVPEGFVNVQSGQTHPIVW